MGSKAHTSPRGKATTSRGKSSLIALCLAVLFCLYLKVANSVFSSNFGRGEKETAAASGDFASTRLAENLIRTGGDCRHRRRSQTTTPAGEGGTATSRQWPWRPWRPWQPRRRGERGFGMPTRGTRAATMMRSRLPRCRRTVLLGKTSALKYLLGEINGAFSWEEKLVAPLIAHK